MSNTHANTPQPEKERRLIERAVLAGEPLTEQDEPMLSTHGLTLADAEDALLRRVNDEQGAELIGQSHRRSAYRDYSGVNFPYVRDGVVIANRLRLDNPELEDQPDGPPKEKNKYVSAPGVRGHLYFAPTVRPEWFDDVSIDVAVFEGEWKTLAGHRLAFENSSTDRPRWLAIGLPGVWNFRGRVGKATNATGKRVDVHGPISDLDLVKWKGRRVKIVFDSDVNTNSQVRIARYELAALLVQRGAIVEFVDVPESPDGSKWGFDDWYGVVGAEPVLDAMARGRLFELSAENVLGIVEDLPETPRTAEIRDALIATARILAGAGKLTVQLVRDGCIRELKKRGAQSPAKIVDAAIGDLEDTAAKPSSELFTDPEPWPDPVDGAALLDEMAATLQRFVFAEPVVYATVALWALFTHVFTIFYCLPILSISAPTKRAGKSTLMSVLNMLVRRPFSISNLTEAVLYRVTEEFAPTLLLDEAETYLRDNEALRGLINSGHTPVNARVPRCVGDTHEVRIFSTFAPKAIAGIGKLADTITDRSIAVLLKRATVKERREHLRLDRLFILEPLRAKAARWALDNADALKSTDPSIPDELTSDRARDNWRSLFAIADAAGGAWPERARLAALALTEGDDDSQSAGEQLIADLYALFYDPERGSERIQSSKIAEYLHKLESRPWAEWGRTQKPITPTGIARLLKGHRTAKGKKLGPDHWREGNETIRGWNREDFQDVFDRYCRGNQNGTPAQGREIIALQESETAHPSDAVPGHPFDSSLQTKDCAVVPTPHTPQGGTPEVYEREGDYTMDGDAMPSRVPGSQRVQGRVTL